MSTTLYISNADLRLDAETLDDLLATLAGRHIRIPLARKLGDRDMRRMRRHRAAMKAAARRRAN